MKFLIIDDDPDFRSLIIRNLQNEFSSAEFAGFAGQREFEEAIRRWDFDVVITDMDNPGLDGLHVCRQIRERDAYLPVIMLTASGNEELAVEGMKSGLSDYVTKRHLLRLPVAVWDCIEKARIRKAYDLTKTRQATQFILTEILAGSASLQATAPKILQAICEGFGWALGELWRVDPESKRAYLAVPGRAVSP